MVVRYKNISDKEFIQIVEKLYDILYCCEICGHQCRIDRLKGQKGKCRASYKLRISSYGLHFGEEEPISGYNGSGTIFFSYCNLHCVFCQNYEISQLAEGIEISEEQLANIMIWLQNKNAHNINLVSPTHFLPQIIKALYLASKQGLNIPVVYNTGGYDNPGVIKLLSDIVDIYMPDMKYSDNENAYKYSSAKNYWEVSTSAVKEMYKQVGGLKIDEHKVAYRGLLIRHLVLPNDIAGSKKIIDFIAENLGDDVYLNIMAQYRPCFKARNYPELNRRITLEEYEEVLNYAISKGIKNIDKEQIMLLL